MLTRILAVAGLPPVLLSFLLAGCASVQPGAVKADVAVPVASPQSGGDQAGLGGLVVKPVAQIEQPNDQRVDAAATVTGEGNRTVVVPVNVSGSAWAIAAVVAAAVGIVVLLAWERRRHRATRKAAGAVMRGIRDLGPGRQRDTLLGLIEQRSEAAGVRDDLDRLAERAKARVSRPAGHRVKVEGRG